MADNGVVIDRSRITHRESKRITILTMMLQKPDGLTPKQAEEMLNEVDCFLEKIFVSVPVEWLPDGVTTAFPGWLDHLTQDNYNELMQAANPAAQDEKKA